MGDKLKILDYTGKEIDVVKKSKLYDTLLGIFWILVCIALISLSTLTIDGIIRNDDDMAKVTPSANATWTHITPSSSYTWTLTDDSEAKEFVAQGDCVDVASAILFMLKRNYDGLAKIQVAVSQNHCQAVLDNNGDKKFLGINADDAIVYEKSREFTDDQFLAYIEDKDFLEAVSIYKSEISIVELLAFLYSK